MANTATARTGPPDFATATLAERSEWLLEQLRGTPGTVEVIKGERWLKLETTGSLVPVIRGLAPALTEEQCKSSSRWLGDQKLRRSDNTGRGTYAHYVKLPAETAGDDGEAPAAGDGSTMAEIEAEIARLVAAVPMLEQAAELIKELRDKLVQAEREKEELGAEITRLTTENGLLQRRGALVAPFYDGLQRLQETIGE